MNTIELKKEFHNLCQTEMRKKHEKWILQNLT